MHNSCSFLDMIQDAASRMPASVTRPPAGGPGSGLTVGPGAAGATGNLIGPEVLGEAAGAAGNLARGLFDSVRKGVEGIALQ